MTASTPTSSPNLQATGINPTTPWPYTDPTATTWAFSGTGGTLTTTPIENPPNTASYTYNGDSLRTGKTVNGATTTYTCELPPLLRTGLVVVGAWLLVLAVVAVFFADVFAV